MKVVSFPGLPEGSIRAGDAWSQPAFTGEESGGGSCIQGTPRGGPLTVNTQPISDRIPCLSSRSFLIINVPALPRLCCLFPVWHHPSSIEVIVRKFRSFSGFHFMVHFVKDSKAYNTSSLTKALGYTHKRFEARTRGGEIVPVLSTPQNLPLVRPPVTLSDQFGLV